MLPTAAMARAFALRDDAIFKHVTKQVIDAMYDGHKCCSTYIIDQDTTGILLDMGYQVEEEREDDVYYYVISWDEKTSQNRNQEGKDHS